MCRLPGTTNTPSLATEPLEEQANQPNSPINVRVGDVKHFARISKVNLEQHAAGKSHQPRALYIDIGIDQFVDENGQR